MSRWSLAVVFVLVAVVGCTATEEVVPIDIAVSHGGGSIGTATRSFTTDQGSTVEITTGLVTLLSVELVRCSATAGVWQRMRRSLALVPVARAHTMTTPTQLGITFVESITRPDDEPTTIGTLPAPAVDFCSVFVTLGPADTDVRGYAEGDEMFRTSLRLVGTYDSGNALSFEAVGGVYDEILFSAPFRPASGESKATVLTLDFRYDRWFDGLDLATARPSEVLHRVGATIELR